MAITSSPVIDRVRASVEPIASDLGLEIYDIEQRGSTLRLTLDTPSGSEVGITLDQLALATRLVSREMDHTDPIPGKYTLEITSPGVERTLRTAAHYQREIGKTVAIRLSDVTTHERRIEGVLVAADETTATVRFDDPATHEPVDRVVQIDQVDRAKTVFVWGPKPKPGGPKNGKTKKAGSKKAASKKAASKKAPANQVQSKSAAGASDVPASQTKSKETKS